MRTDLKSALAAAQTYRGAAQAALAERLAARPIDREQRAAHGFAWVATMVAALEAVLDWLDAGQGANPLDAKIEIGRASCRERVCQYVEISGVAVSFKKKQNITPKHK